jgi:hypothetical protein
MTILHETTFDYVRPTDEQMSTMAILREAAGDYAQLLEDNILDGPDKTYLLRKLREVAMWANIAVTRQTNGEARG